MKIALIYPPTCDPTAPYISVPLLTGYLRARGIEVLPLDANIGAYRHLLKEDALRGLAARVEERFRSLDQRPRLEHPQQVEYAELWSALREGSAVAAEIQGALRTLRGGEKEGFFAPHRYQRSVSVLAAALKLISAAYWPLELDFAAYRSPYALLSAREIAREARPERDPFQDYFHSELIPRLEREEVGLAGISIAFPGQIQPAYSLAYAIRRRLPHVHLCAGGPALTQLLVKLSGQKLAQALGPFDTAVLFEGEEALLALVEELQRGGRAAGVIRGDRATDLSGLPAPDFSGLPLEDYLSPEPVLPYDASRGCYWGRCAFCHYGLAEAGTAAYRERPPELAAEHLSRLAERHGGRVFYLSEDTLAPKTLLALAGALKAGGSGIRWSTDLRAEAGLTDAACRGLREGGALSFSLGLESGSPRLLRLINKGIPLGVMKQAVANLSGNGIAAEFMGFTGFPTETYAEAMATVRLLEELRERLSLFMCGEFALTGGSRVAGEPERFGIRSPWTVRGDEFATELFYTPQRPFKSGEEGERIDRALEALASRWWLNRYPWAGSLSTAHTLLWYERFGPAIFREVASRGRPSCGLPRGSPDGGRYDARRIGERAAAVEEEIWNTLVYKERRVSREAYRRLACSYYPVFPRGGPELRTMKGGTL